MNPLANATPGGSRALRMSVANRIGPAKSLKVFPGDKIDASVYSYYGAASGLTPTSLNTLITALASVMSGGDGVITDGISTAYTNPSANPDIALSPFEGSTTPSAFINYILFDQNYVPLEAKSFPVGATAGIRTLISMSQVSVKELGHLFIYLSFDNESSNWVYFDDFKIKHTESPVIQVNGYYPYGMAAYSWVREGESENKYLYQGKEYDDKTQWHDFHARQYDGALGRWFASDPESQFSSPYTAMGNNPVSSVDPDGKIVWFVPVIIGAVIGGYSAYNASENQGMNFGERALTVFAGAAVGAVLGYASWAGSGFAGTVVSGAFQGGAQSALSGGNMVEGIWKGALSSGIGYGLSAGGIAIGKSLIKDGAEAAQASDGLINMGYEIASTTTKSVTNNVLAGNKPFSSLDIGAGDFTLHFRNGKLSRGLVDNLDNLASLYGYGRGFLDVLQRKAKFEGFDKFAFSPKFRETTFSANGAPLNLLRGEDWAYDPSNKGFITRILDRNGTTKMRRASGINLFGAILLSHGSGSETKIHELFHSIDSRIKGPFIDYVFSYLLYKGRDYGAPWYEKRIGFGY